MAAASLSSFISDTSLVSVANANRPGRNTTRRALQHALTAERLGLRVDPTPLAAASVGQVHMATLTVRGGSGGFGGAASIGSGGGGDKLGTEIEVIYTDRSRVVTAGGARDEVEVAVVVKVIYADVRRTMKGDLRDMKMWLQQIDALLEVMEYNMECDVINTTAMECRVARADRLLEGRERATDAQRDADDDEDDDDDDDDDDASRGGGGARQRRSESIPTGAERDDAVRGARRDDGGARRGGAGRGVAATTTAMRRARPSNRSSEWLLLWCSCVVDAVSDEPSSRCRVRCDAVPRRSGFASCVVRRRAAPLAFASRGGSSAWARRSTRS